IQRVMDVSSIVDGAFRYTFADRNEFYYIINYQSFGGDLGRQTIPLKNGESVSAVTGVLDWTATGSNLNVDLQGDRSTVVVRGVFSGTTLKVPMASGSHKVLIESDPEQKLTVSGNAKEIDLSEIRIPPTYPTALAFLASASDTFQISIQELGVFPSLVASVERAQNRIAVTSKGSIVGEMNYQYANTGLDYLQVDVPGTPLYASTEESAIKLTKEDTLLLAFPKTQRGNFDVVYFDTRHQIFPIDLISVPIAHTDLPISTARTQVYLPKNVFVLETFGADGGSEIPWQLLGLLVVIFAIMGALLKKGKKFVTNFTLLSFALYVFNPFLLAILLIGAIIYLIKSHIHLKKLKPLLAGAGVIIVIILIFVVLGGIFSSGSYQSVGGVESSAEYGMTGMMVESAPMPKFAVDFDELGGGDNEAAAIVVPTKKGVLPVKLEIPSMGKQISVTNYLVTKEKPLKLSILVISTYFKYLLYLFGIFAGFRVYKDMKGK
ncbi:hypothetical protein ACFLQI_03370, partial [Candidatus Undinarchaeota archaeon]